MIWHTISANETAKELDTDIKTGLTEGQVQQRRKLVGANELQTKKKKSLLRRFLEQFNDFMIIILIIAAGVSFTMSVLEGDANFIDPIIILAIVILNAILGIIQESKAEKSLEALQKLSAPHAKVRRSGRIITVEASELVPGDIIFLETGDSVPADARLVSSTMLKVEESSLTGESMSVDKDDRAIVSSESGLGDRKNMVFSSTTISQGRGCAIVTETGMQTQVGKIATMISSEEEQQTPLQQKLDSVGKTLGIGALIICAVIFTIGVLRAIPPFDMFMTSVSLAVAAIPEGLPAIVTIMLALGVQRMARKNAIIRKLPAVETLGGATVICSDKTGTLTQNKMTVIETYGDANTILTLGSLCNNATEEDGDPTEIAIVTAAYKAGLRKEILEKQFLRTQEIPFDSKRKLMTTVHKLPTGYRIITKGAPDVLLKLCSRCLIRGNSGLLTLDLRKKIMEQNTVMAEKALRVLAVAYRDVTVLPRNLEEELTFAGMLGMIDPPRKEVKKAVAVCRRAGIKPVMITGDHVVTARAIAGDLGILGFRDKAMTGEELDKLSQRELEQKIYDYSVFARVSPEHKVRIVKAFQKRGAVVAMTGDGVNDAPALKAADIGCAMGVGGTDVAKGAADMVLTDDNFATIVEAVREGRGIFANIKKAVHFLLSSNIGEILTIFLGILLGYQSPLLAIQLLWVNLVTDSLPAIALGLDAPEADIMSQSPRNYRKGIFADGLWFTIILEGCMIGLLTLFAYNVGCHASLAVGRTMAFAVLSISQLVHAFNMRSEGSIFSRKLKRNKYLNGAFIVGLAMQCSVIMIPALAKIFKVVPLDLGQWMIVALLALAPILIVEIEKWSKRPPKHNKF